MSIIEIDGYSFDFPDAADAFVFDETDQSKPNFHGVTQLKCVDIIAEFEDSYIFIEIKDYDDPSISDVKNSQLDHQRKTRQEHFRWLKNYLKYKYRDSYLYRHAEDKVNKPIHYICLTNFDNALNHKMQKDLKYELPVGKVSKRWNQNFPKWKLCRLADV